MKIAVCVKHVPEGTSRMDPGTKRLDRSGEGALNHFDANAVEEALRLKGDSDTEVVVVSLGPQKALDSLRKALAMGADRAVLVSDEAAAGSDLVATSRLLAAALAVSAHALAPLHRTCLFSVSGHASCVHVCGRVGRGMHGSEPHHDQQRASCA